MMVWPVRVGCLLVLLFVYVVVLVCSRCQWLSSNRNSKHRPAGGPPAAGPCSWILGTGCCVGSSLESYHPCHLVTVGGVVVQ